MSILTPSEEQQIRITICKYICPDYNSIIGTCKICGCQMGIKTRLNHSRCKKNCWDNPDLIAKAQEILHKK